MKTFLTYIVAICGILMTFSCGEDRTWQYEEKTQHNHWMQDMMLDKYLWRDSLVNFEPEWKKFFGKPSEFLSTLTARSKQGDSWSYVEIDTLSEDSHKRGNYNHVNSYGFDFVLMNDPTGATTKQVFRVVTVYPGSPADRAGLVRNDFICSYNGNKLNSTNVSKLQSGVARSLEVRHIAQDELEGGIYWLDTTTVALPASEYVEDKAFPLSTIILVDEKKVGYLMCTRLLEYPIENQARQVNTKVYQDVLDGMMAQMKSAGVSEMVLDLRLCNFGTLEMARRLASYVVSPGALSSTFAKTFWNERYKSNNLSLPYDTSVGNLGLSRVYILTSSYTQGAAEWLIHALQHSMGEENVILIGEATKGQNVMTQEVDNKYHVHLFPVVAYVADGAGDYEYGSIEPAIEIDELNYVTLAAYSNPDEILLNTAIRHMLGLISQNDSDSEKNSDNLTEEETVE